MSLNFFGWWGKEKERTKKREREKEGRLGACKKCCCVRWLVCKESNTLDKTRKNSDRVTI